MSETFSRLTAAEIDVESALDEDLFEKIDENQQAVYLRSAMASYAFAELFGDGSDGASPASATESRAHGNDGLQYNSAYTIDAAHTVTMTAGSQGFVKLGVRGTFTLNGTITVTPAGYAGGAGGVSNASGSDGSGSTLRGLFSTQGGGGGGGAGGSDGGNGGPTHRDTSPSNGATPTSGNGGVGHDADTSDPYWYRSISNICPGTGGGGGGAVSGNDGGAGGTGGCVLIIEAEAVVFGASAAINVLGADGSAGTGTGAAGGGGGGGGTVVVLSPSITDGGVTITVTGGSGGAGVGIGGDGGDGGDGRSAQVTLG